MLDLGTGYYNQVIGKPDELIERSKNAGEQECFMYAAFLEPMCKQRNFILYDPKTDKMYQSRQVISPKTPHFEVL